MTRQPDLSDAFAPVAEGLREVMLKVGSLADSEHSPQIRTMLEHVVESRGRQIRSGLLLLTANMWDGRDPKVCVNLGAAIEILHLATLIHDDMVDNSDLRRGRRTLNAIWGNDFALMVGDLLFGTSMELVCESNSVPIITRCARVVRELSHGELRESVNSGRVDLSRAEYERIVYEKTACLFACATQVGAMAGGATGAEEAALEAFGSNLGMAYQILDDVADYEQSPEQASKPTMNDLREGIITLPAIIAAENGANRELHRLFEDTSKEQFDSSVAEAYRAVIESGAVEKARAVATEFRSRALEALEDLAKRSGTHHLIDAAHLIIPAR